jgi:AcrR family transcriptional regulator
MTTRRGPRQSNGARAAGLHAVLESRRVICDGRRMTRAGGVTGGAIDGRVRRSERSRHAIVAALLDLVGRGVLQPTARQVADEAGVGIRSVFRHFSEMESLYAAMDARLEGAAASLLTGGRRTGAIADRVRALVRQRALLFERIAPYKRSANLQRRRSAFLQRRQRRLHRALRDDLLAWLPELAVAPTDLVEALDHATSFESWDRLRGDRGLGRRMATAVVERTALALLRASRR